MLQYNVEFTKGVLFIRLLGTINSKNEKTIENDLYEILNDGGIKYLVFNLEDLEIEENINLFLNCDEIIKNNDGKMLLCGNYNGNYITNFDCVDNELSALKEFSLC